MYSSVAVLLLLRRKTANNLFIRDGNVFLMSEKENFFMKKSLTFLAAAAVALFISACSTVGPVAGATGTVGSKTGEAKQAFIFGFPLKGEGGIMQAAQNGGITRVGTVDLRIDWPASPIIPYFTLTTVVSGE